MQKLKFNYLIALLVSHLKVGMRRKLRYIKILRVNLFIRILRILYQYGIIRTFQVHNDLIWVYFKYYKGLNICKNICIVSKPSKRAYVSLNKLSRTFSNSNFSGFYIISTVKGFVTTNYCLLDGHMGGELLIKVEI